MRWLIILYIAKTTNAFGYKFENSTDDAGILFIPLNRVQLTYDEWHLCYYYDLREYYDGITKLEASVEDLRSICNEPLMASDHAVAGHLCKSVINQFDAHFDTLRVKTDTIKSFRVNSKRTKRAPLEFVGGLMSAVFGVMDAKDADRYNNQIKQLHENAQYQNELIRQQTTIVESTIETHNSSLHDMRTHMIDLRNDIDTMKRAWVEGSDDLYMKTHFNMVAHLTTLALPFRYGRSRNTNPVT